MRTKKSKASNKELVITSRNATRQNIKKIASKPRVSPATKRNKKTKISDEQLANIIGTDARLSAEKLASKLKVSPTTLRRHIKSATRNGIMRTVALVDPTKAGLTVQTIIGFNVSRSDLDSVLKALEKESEIKWLAAITGKFDIMARAAFASIDDLSAFLGNNLGNIKGINNIESFICLDVSKGRFISID